MKSFAVIAAVAGVAVAQNLGDCAQLCVNNMARIANTEFSCGQGDTSCFCSKSNWAYGIRDCSAQACDGGQAAQAVAYANSQCQGVSAPSGSQLAAIPILSSALATVSGDLASVTGSVASGAASATGSAASAASSAASGASAAVSSATASAASAASSLGSSLSAALSSVTGSLASRASSATAAGGAPSSSAAGAAMVTGMPLVAGVAGFAALFL